MKGRIINKLITGITLGLFPLSVLAADGKTTFQLEHKFKTMDRRHHDTIKLIHKTPALWQYELKFGASGGSGRNYDVAWDDMQGAQEVLLFRKTLSFRIRKVP